MQQNDLLLRFNYSELMQRLLGELQRSERKRAQIAITCMYVCVCVCVSTAYLGMTLPPGLKQETDQ